MFLGRIVMTPESYEGEGKLRVGFRDKVYIATCRLIERSSNYSIYTCMFTCMQH